MASISSRPDGSKRLSFVLSDKKRRTVYLGKVSIRDAQALQRHVETILTAQATANSLPAETQLWLARLPAATLAKFQSAELIRCDKAKPAETELGSFLDSYLAGRTDLKPATRVVRFQIIRDLKEFFGETRDARTVTPGECDDFKVWLVGRGLASSTICKRLQNARWFFHAMRRRKLIGENPFDGVSMVASGVRDRQRFVTRAETAAILAHCPDHHWRTIIALCRFGGLRNPSETLSLRWQDVDWSESRIVVTSPKTEHHADGASRTIPLFPELRPFLEESFDRAAEGEEFVVDQRFLRAAIRANGWANSNLRTTLLKIIRRAGLKSWPRPFHNMRASRETELVERYPVQVVTAWLGNSPKVAMKHYLMTTDSHFASAVADSTEPTEPPGPTKEAMQKATRAVLADGGNSEQLDNSQNEETPEFQGFAIRRKSLQCKGIAGTGFEPVTSRL